MTGKIPMTKHTPLFIYFLLSAILSALLPASALAHEPLWGETPQTFAFGVIHPEIRVGRNETRLGLQYAFNTTRNIRLEFASPPQVAHGQKVAHGRGGQFGDPSLSLKSRLHVRFGPDFKQMSAAIVGVERHGGQLGYAFAHERLTDTIWASVVYAKRQTDLDASYGYWIKRAHTPSDTGVITAIGLHRESTNRKSLQGIHGSLIVTKGQMQTRIGVLFSRHERAQIRFGWEILL
jgi:hypothetical protein